MSERNIPNIGLDSYCFLVPKCVHGTVVSLFVTETGVDTVHTAVGDVVGSPQSFESLARNL